MTLLTIVLILWFNRFLQILFVDLWKKTAKIFQHILPKGGSPQNAFWKVSKTSIFVPPPRQIPEMGDLSERWWELWAEHVCIRIKKGRIQETSQLSRFEMGGGGSDRWWEPCPAPGNTSWSVEAHFRSTIILPPMTIISPSAIIPPFKP